MTHSYATQAAQALKQARDFLEAECREEDDDVRDPQLWSPAAVVATAANALNCVQRLDTAIGNDGFTLHDTTYAAMYLMRMENLTYVLRRSLGRAAAAIEAWPEAGGLAHRITAEFDEMRDMLESVSNKFNAAWRTCIEGRSIVGRRDEAQLSSGIRAELEARGLGPLADVSPDDRMVAQFVHQGVPCRIFRDEDYWRAAPMMGDHWARGMECGPFDATYHPAQIVSWALLAIDYMLGKSGHPICEYDPLSYVQSSASPGDPARFEHGETP